MMKKRNLDLEPRTRPQMEKEKLNMQEGSCWNPRWDYMIHLFFF